MFQFATSLKANLFFPSTPVSSLRPPRIHHTRSLILFSNTHNTAPSPQKKISSGSLFLTHFPISDFRSLLYVLTIHATSCKLQSLRPTSKKKIIVLHHSAHRPPTASLSQKKNIKLTSSSSSSSSLTLNFIFQTPQQTLHSPQPPSPRPLLLHLPHRLAPQLPTPALLLFDIKKIF
jgi:hypothetical protein